MVQSGEIKLESGFASMKKRGLQGDFKFVLIDRIMLNDFKLSNIDSFTISLHSLVKRLSIPAERAFNLDNTSIIVEKVPIIIDQPVSKRIKRI
jgi:KUP system potassium uptake protein